MHLSQKQNSSDNEDEFSDIEQVYSVLRILLDPANLAKQEVGKILEEYIQGKEFNEEDEEQLKPWSPIELVHNFRKLNENRLAYLKTGYLKPEKFEEYQKLQDKFTFKPQISETSQMLEQKNLTKFIHTLNEEDIEKQYYSQNPQSKEQENFPPYNQTSSGNKSRQTVNDSALVNQSGLEGQERYKLLFLRNQVKEQQIQKKLEEKQQKELDQCTFTPQILVQSKKMVEKKEQNQNYVSRLFKRNPYQKKEELKKRAIQEKELSEMQSCTFHPTINQASIIEIENQYDNKIDLPKGFEQTVGRMRHGYSNYYEKKQKLEHIPNGENYEKILKKNIQPFDFSQDKQFKKQQPFIYIDVNVGGGKTGRIGLHENDNPYEVAKNFAMAFQLNLEMQTNLQTLIENQIEQFLEEQEQN